MASTKIPLELTAYAPDADGATLELQTTDTTVTDGSVLGKIEFKAPKEASGTDAILVGAAIEAVAEGTFAADNNATELVFKTGASEAAAQKMVLTSAGNVGIGTASPARALSTKSSSVTVGSFESTSASGGLISFVDSNTTDDVHVRVGAVGDNLVLQAGGSERMRLSGNNLHLNGGTDARIQLGSGGAGANSTSNDTVHIRGDGDSMKLMTAADGNYIFEVNGSEKVRIHSSGYMKIKDSGNDHYGLVLEADNNDAWVRMGHDGTDGRIHTTYNASAGATPLKLGVHGHQEAITIDTSGHVTMPHQSAFTATKSADTSNVAINGFVGVVFDTEIFDQNADYNTNGNFTAPVTGRYQLSININFDGYPNDGNYLWTGIVTSNRTYYLALNPTGSPASSNYENATGSVLADMDANDTAYVFVLQGGGSQNTDIVQNSFFSGYLVC
jgi:hypothetical protein